MARKNRPHDRGHKRARTGHSPAPLEPLVRTKLPPVEYGKAFTVLEDEGKNTFEYKSGSWVPFSMSIAECRQLCEIKQLPQKVNRMTRYEVRLPVSSN